MLNSCGNVADCDYYRAYLRVGGDWSSDRHHSGRLYQRDDPQRAKVVLVVLAFDLVANYMLINLTDYFAFIFDQITQIG